MTEQHEYPQNDATPPAPTLLPVGGTTDGTVALRVPKPNIQVTVLGLVALITVFQTFQLIRLNTLSSSGLGKVAPAVSSPASTGSSADVPQSMVGGC